MTTPICDFVDNYIKSGQVRLHMPGHKGKSFLGCEDADITEIDGADSLFEASGIIAESERNASSLFGSKCFYSTEGSSLAIRGMLYLFRLWAGENGRIIAARNCHKTFLSGVALLDLNVEWLTPKADSNYLSCQIDLTDLESRLANSHEKTAVYITSPDYLGGMADIRSISALCEKYNAKLLVDNAHGAYLKFLPESRHPMDLGASMCCDSAHKTLPVLTGGAYLHINQREEFFASRCKDALSLFGSTSPSYLILQSLDNANLYISKGYKQRLYEVCDSLRKAKQTIKEMGFDLYGDEELKITILPKSHGQTGIHLAEMLKSKGIFSEFADNDALVLMFTAENSVSDFNRLITALKDIPTENPLPQSAPSPVMAKRVCSLRSAILSNTEMVKAENSVGRIFAGFGISCPPAVPLIIGGEEIDQRVMESFKYYGIKECLVIKND